MNIIDLATKTMQATINAAVSGIRSVVDAIKTTTDATKTTVDTIDSRIGSQTSSASSSTSANAHAKLNYLTSRMPTGVVKSVQRGTFAPSHVTTPVEVTISSVNINKAFVYANNKGDRNVTGRLTSSTKITFDIGSLGEHDWQVIEFY